MVKHTAGIGAQGGVGTEARTRPWLGIARLVWLAWLSLLQPVRAAETVTLYVTNAQGTVVAEMTPQGQVTYTAAYRPYGQQVMGMPQAGPGYTGHVNDPDTGLVYMQQRYYDPEIGRFLSIDPMGPSSGNVFSLNRYTYANNNPYTNIDPDGLSACPGSSETKCIQADTYDASRSTGQTTQASEPVANAMVSQKEVVAVHRGGSKEKIGFVMPTAEGGPEVQLAADATTASTGRTDSATATKPAGAEAVVHGHIDGRSDGFISPADAAPLKSNLPNGVVSEGRVGVTEIVSGRLQFRTLKGRMTRREVRGLQKSLDKQQLQPGFILPEDTL